MKHSIRQATRDELDVVRRLWLDLIEHHRRLDPDYPATPGIREVLGRELERALASPQVRVLVALRDGQPVAFAFGEIDGPTASPSRGRIEELYVAPEARRSGLGGALVGGLESFFAESGVHRVEVRTEAPNAQALAFWRERGFAPRAHVLGRRLPRLSPGPASETRLPDPPAGPATGRGGR